MANIDWGKIEAPKSGGGKFLKLDNGKHKVRLIGKPYLHFKHWEPIPANCGGLESGCPICARAVETKNKSYYPRQRYAINCIDRDDNNALKILDAGSTIFSTFRTYGEQTKIDPSGKDGPDFIIVVDVPGSDVRHTKYQVIPLANVPFTDAEKKRLNEGLHNLEDTFKVDSNEEITNRLSGDKKPEAAVTPVTPAAVKEPEEFKW